MNNTEAAREVQTQGGRDFFSAFLDHTKCPPASTESITCLPGTGAEGFFRLGDLRLYGRANGGSTSSGPSEILSSIDFLVRDGNGSVALPFDPTEIINNLRFEKYAGGEHAEFSHH